MIIDGQDIERLRAGQPPQEADLLRHMTVGRDLWIDVIREYYLSLFIAQNGSKVKVLVGDAGSGKSHLLRSLAADARDLDYQVVYLSLRNCEIKLNDLPGLYRAIASNIDRERLFRGLCCRVGTILGYDQEQYDGMGRLLPRMVEDGLGRGIAEKELRNAAGKAFKNADFGPSFTAFAYTVVKDRMVNGGHDASDAAWKWFCGDKMERRVRHALGFYEQLQKSNARYWLNSLVRMLRLAGMAGLVVLVDDGEVIAERDAISPRFIYTPNAAKDACEMIRQLIDDSELLNYFLFVIAGRSPMVWDEKRGFRSYEALWMRLQSGLIPVERFNRLSDMVDVDRHKAALGENAAGLVGTRLQDAFSLAGFERKYREDIPIIENQGTLRGTVMETAWMATKKEAPQT